jgi:hypothetical protein
MSQVMALLFDNGRNFSLAFQVVAYHSNCFLKSAGRITAAAVTGIHRFQIEGF